MKVLYCNPIFLNYRIPFYKRLNELFKGEFLVLYGRNRYKNRLESVLECIDKDLKGIAYGFDGDYTFNPSLMKFNTIGGNAKHYIPITIGLTRRIRPFKPDVLITEGFFQWTPWVILYSLFHRVPVYLGYERTLHTERNTKWYLTLQRRITDKFIKGYFVNGSETKKYLVSIGIKESKIHVAGMNADADGLKKSIGTMTDVQKNDFRSKFISKNGLLFLFTGYLIERKGIRHLLESWMEHIKEYPDDSLVIVGNGDQYEECVSRYGMESTIHFEGRVDYQEIHKYYAIADVYVMPTIEDNWSLVIPEAMSCGLPVATSIYNGCHTDLIKEGINGFVFDTFNHQSIIDTLGKFHKVNLPEMGKASVEMEQPFNTENCAKRLYDVIQKQQ